MEPDMPLDKYLFAERYRTVRKIGKGSFGIVYLAVDITSKEKVAIKLESVTKTEPTLPHEGDIYKNLTNGDSVPTIRYIGEEHGYNCIVMDLLGPSLRKLQRTYKNFTLSCIIQLTNQMLSILEYIHNHSIVHRDLKPENIVIGRGTNSNHIYIVDFGLAAQYNKPDPNMEKCNFVGNAIFASCNTHNRCAPAPRDDLESLGYLIVYFLRGKLPWSGIKADLFDEKVTKTGQIKLATSVEELCDGLPDEFGTYLKYCRGLQSTDVPDYEYLRELFDKLAKKMNFLSKNVFDWTGTKQS